MDDLGACPRALKLLPVASDSQKAPPLRSIGLPTPWQSVNICASPLCLAASIQIGRFLR